MDYNDLDQYDFDAIVTGELTHFALRLEEEVNKIITDYFIKTKAKTKSFRRLFLLRDGLTFQDKIEIVRGMLPLFKNSAEVSNLRKILNQVEKFKSWRNAMAHGFDASESHDYDSKLTVEIVTRSGKEKRIEITPESHERMISNVIELLERLEKSRKEIDNS